MSLITVNEDKCIKCGLCIKECPTFVLKMGQKGPEAISADSCIACGHCTAVCPKEAIDNIKSPLASQINSKDFPKLDAAEAEHFLRSRRSIRTYKEESVSKEELTKLVNIARLAPTGSNAQGVSFVAILDTKIVKEALEETIKWMETSQLKDRFKGLTNAYREFGVDGIFRGAPNLVLTTADKDFSRGRENSIFSLAYLELYAPSLGLGSCWAGLFEVCALLPDSPMLKLFNIPEGKRITGAVMVGYPKYSFNRLVDRNPLEVTFI